MTRDELQAYVETYMQEHPEVAWKMDAAELTQYIITVRDAVRSHEPVIINSPEVATLWRWLPYRYGGTSDRHTLLNVPTIS